MAAVKPEGPPAVPRWSRAALAVGGCALVIVGLYTSVHHWRGPVGWDSTQYVWRTTLATGSGITSPPERLPTGVRVKLGRPGFPAVASVLSATQGASLFEVAGTLPLAAAAAVGTGAMALLSGTRLRRGPLMAIGVIAGISPNVVLMLQYAYFDNLLVALVFLAALAATDAAVEERRAIVAGAVLLGISALIHSAFFLVGAAVVLGAAVLLLPASRRARVGGYGWPDTPSGRFGLVGLGGAAVAGASLAVLDVERARPMLDRSTFDEKLRNDVSVYRLPVAVPAASVGAWLGGRHRDGRSGPVVALLAAWTLTALLGLALGALTSVAVPTNRLFVFALGLPLLVGLGAWLLGERFRERWAWGPAVLLGAAILAFAGLGVRQWASTSSHTDPTKLVQAAWLASYLETTRVPTDRPIVVTVDDRGSDPALQVDLMIDHLLAAMPENRIDDVYAFLGSPEDYLAGRPSSLPGNLRYDRTSARLLARLDSASHPEPVAVTLPSFSGSPGRTWREAHPELRAGVGTVVSGPVPRSEVAVPELRLPERSPRLVLQVLATLLILFATGIGWAMLLFGSPLRILGTAPAVGLAAILVIALAADRLGLRVEGATAVGVALVTALAGWVAAALGGGIKRWPS